MSENVLDFMEPAPAGAEGAPAPAPAPTPEPAEAPAAAAAPGAPPAAEGDPAPAAGTTDRPRGADGKFAKTPAADAPTDQNRVPVGEHIRIRERAQAAEAERDELRRQVDALKPPAQATEPPDRYADPDGYDAWQQKQLDTRFQTLELRNLNDRLNFSERLARSEHGAELVEEAKAWAKTQADPTFAQALRADPDPYGFVVKSFQDNKTSEALRDPATLAAFREWQAGKAPTQPTDKSPAPSRPSRSIVAAPGAGGGTKPGETPAGPGEAYNSLF